LLSRSKYPEAELVLRHIKWKTCRMQYFQEIEVHMA